MARGGRRGGGGRGGDRPKRPGAEKYGEDPADVALRLHEDDVGSENDQDSDGDGEEDVMAQNEDDDGVWPPPGTSSSANAGQVGRGDEASGPGTKGWRGADFYGGDAGGDDSDGGSDDDLVLAEAKKLEEVRARRLKGEDDPLAALVGPASDKPEALGASAPASASSALPSAASKFESVFAAEAEHASVPRDLSKLSEGKKKGLVKSEAPELQPLLTDFRMKLEGLQELMPLLSPKALARMPASGASYLKSKASLILNTLANLSFYILLRAEGGEVRTHPVISQLVWLRELNEQMSPLDKKLGKKIKRALLDVKKLRKAEQLSDTAQDNDASDDGAKSDDEPRKATSARKSLRDRLERLRPLVGTDKKAALKANGRRDMDTDDLLRLPKRRRGPGGGAPEDLDDLDPLLGMWRPSTTIGEQLSSVQQQLNEKAARAKPQSSDVNVEPKPRKLRERPADVDHEQFVGKGKGKGKEADVTKDDNDDDADGLIKDALAVAAAKKGKKATEKAARDEAALQRQNKPELELEGRRKTSARILKNRGLVRDRKKTAGNARVTNRNKYEKKIKARKGAVREMREGAADGASYGGEETGVRTHLKKSLTLDSYK